MINTPSSAIINMRIDGYDAKVTLAFGDASLGAVLKLFWLALRSRTVTVSGPMVREVHARGIAQIETPNAERRQ